MRDICTILKNFTQVLNVTTREGSKPQHVVATILQDGANASVREDSMCRCSSSNEANEQSGTTALHGVCIQRPFSVVYVHAHVRTLPAITVLVHGQTTCTLFRLTPSPPTVCTIGVWTSSGVSQYTCIGLS